MNNKPTDSGDKLIKDLEDTAMSFGAIVEYRPRKKTRITFSTQALEAFLDNYLVEARLKELRSIKNKGKYVEVYPVWLYEHIKDRIKQLKSHTKDKLEPIDGSYKHIPNAEKISQDDLKNQLEDK